MGGVATDGDGRTRVPGLFAVGEAACSGAHGGNRLASNSLLEGLVFGYRAAEAIDAPWAEAPEWLTAAEGRAVVRDVLADEESPESLVFSRSRTQELMWQAAGVLRDGARLRAAASELASTLDPAPGEDANLLLLARLVVAAAQSRAESRGAHFRADFPLTETGAAVHTVLAATAKVPAAC
jgi:L-aspartate oxidase